MPDYYVRAILDIKYNELDTKVRTPRASLRALRRLIT